MTKAIDPDDLNLDDGDNDRDDSLRFGDVIHRRTITATASDLIG